MWGGRGVKRREGGEEEERIWGRKKIGEEGGKVVRMHCTFLTYILLCTSETQNCDQYMHIQTMKPHLSQSESC